MLKLFLSLVVLCFVATSFGQTFQYSHGWTNGKRALSTHRDVDISEMLGVQQDGDRRLERCLMQLQHILRNPLQIRAGVQALTPTNNNANKNPFGNHHQSNELYEELNAAEANDYGNH
ncbi:PREDICTED: pro-corazonin [Rhagoletis zephyria]|uniref:pro-corazonin n=1 Tax=Rhagoletis zephyria TaxID=28612 RepID=UPI000811713D|nr:PREDICTED: pro-corazonin [Rhagoletis zephyria]